MRRRAARGDRPRVPTAGLASITPAGAAALAVGATNDAVETLAIFLEWDLAVVLSQEVEEPLVVSRLHVEEPRDDLIVPARFLQTLAHDLTDVRPRDLPLHVERVDAG